MRISWVHPDVAEQVRAVLRSGRASWAEVFDGDEVVAGPRPAHIGVPDELWPPLADHLARVERVREVVAVDGLEAAGRRFGGSPHAAERAALVAAAEEAGDVGPGRDLASIAALLACRIDEHLAYGPFLSLLVQAGRSADADRTVAVYERFIEHASAWQTTEPSWPERVRLARDGLADLYARVGRHADAERLFEARFAEEPTDTAIPISAARAFLEAGETARSVAWLERAAARAVAAGRLALAAQLEAKRDRLRARLRD